MITRDAEGHHTMANKPPKPAPLETDPEEQKDDNIDAFGRKPDGSKQ
ncbi:hypothetical protein [Devosia sp. SL43]|nr:hypothetical protein [Devosia sp. SL43]UJW85921.1 hypothetical protein IM737_01090 [Devosia sp. SL43]